jgi:hypothetical protein
MDIRDRHKNNKQRFWMLINDLLYVLTVGWIVNETVLINKHHAWLFVTSGCEFVNGVCIVDFSFLPPACQVPG